MVAMSFLGCGKDGEKKQAPSAASVSGGDEAPTMDPQAELARKILILDAALEKLERELGELRAAAQPDAAAIADREAKIEALQMTLRQSRIRLRTMEQVDERP